jgi:hypothetical protein
VRDPAAILPVQFDECYVRRRITRWNHRRIAPLHDNTEVVATEIAHRVPDMPDVAGG